MTGNVELFIVSQQHFLGRAIAHRGRENLLAEGYCRIEDYGETSMVLTSILITNYLLRFTASLPHVRFLACISADGYKKRVPVIKWLINFCKNYDRSTPHKGLYLHGTFGCGKTYLISAAFNELAKKRVTTEIVYLPELLRDLKSDFDSFSDRIDYLENVDLLLIDDIGAEKVTEWSRDEVLGTILQYRMQEGLTTFFTSNLTIKDLEEHFSFSARGIEKVKAKKTANNVPTFEFKKVIITNNKKNRKT